MSEPSRLETPNRIPLFPLSTVLFPGGLLPLRIFEPRYLDMVSETMRGGTPFGVVAIASGSEVGQPPDIYGLGTSARIVSFDQGDDGLLHIVAEGVHAFRVTGHDVAKNQLLMGEVDYEPPVDSAPLPARYTYLAELLKEIFENNREHVLHETWRLDDAMWIAYRLAEVLPLDVTDRLTVLDAAHMDDALAHLHVCLEAMRSRLSDAPGD